MPVPKFMIRADGRDVTSNLTSAGLMTMTISDGEGLRADTLQIEIDDQDGAIIAPRRGAVLNPIGGYEGRMRDFGLFVVDNVTFSGWPQRVSVSAKSVEALSLAKQREPAAYPPDKFPTYGDIFEQVASRVGLTLKMAPELRSIPNDYEAQTDEDALEFTTRVAERMNAAVSVKAGNLVVVVKGAGQSASGAPLDQLIVAKGVNLVSYTATVKDEPKHGEVEASWYDRARNEREVVTESTGLEGPKFLLRAPFQSREDAERAAKAQARELQRMQGDATFDIDGEPFAQAEAWALVRGVRSNVDGLWRVTNVTHQFSSAGPYTTSLTCGVPSGDTGDQVVPGAAPTYANSAPTSTGRAAGPV
jgi:phage protein D